MKLVVGITTMAIFLSISIAILQEKEEDRTTKQLKDLNNDADMVIIGKVIEVGKSPGFWSGIVPAVQTVTYSVVGVLRGECKEDKITVEHILVCGSATSDPEKPELSPKVFRKDAYLIVFIMKVGGNYACVNEDCGVWTAPGTKED